MSIAATMFKEIGEALENPAIWGSPRNIMTHGYKIGIDKNGESYTDIKAVIEFNAPEPTPSGKIVHGPVIRINRREYADGEVTYRALGYRYESHSLVPPILDALDPA